MHKIYFISYTREQSANEKQLKIEKKALRLDEK